MASDVFKGFDASAIPDLGAELRWVPLATGETLFRQGDPGDGVYVLARGRLHITLEYPDGSRQIIDELSPGVSVGEMALLTGQPRAATVSAVEDAGLVYLSRASFERLSEKNPAAMLQFAESMLPRMRRTLLADIMRNLFGDLSRSALHDVEAELVWQDLRHGEILFRPGDPSDVLYIVVNGRLSIVAEATDGSQRVVGEVSRGESIGELALLTGEERTEMVYAIRDTQVVKLAKISFERLVEQYPRAMLQITRMIVKHTRAGGRAVSARGTTVVTLAVIPAGPAVPLPDFARRLAQVLATFGPTLHLNSEQCDRLVGKTGLAQTPEEHPTSVTLAHWLGEQENKYDYIVYEADRGWSAWTSRCVSQADRVLIVGQAGADPRLGEVETAMRRFSPVARQELVLLHPLGTRQPSGTRRWLAERQDVMHHHVRIDVDADLRRLTRRLLGRGVGLVLGSGGARGLAQIGVLQALHEAGVPIDLVGGTSIGALIAAGHAAGMDISAITAAATRFGAPKYVFDYTIPLVSFFSGRKVTRALHDLFGDLRIEDLWWPYFCVSTNLTQARSVIHRSGPLWKYIRASTAIPAIFSPVLDQGDVLVDGAVMNSLPINIMHELCEGGTVIAVDTSVEIDLRKNYQFGLSVSGWQVLWSKLNPFAQPLRVPSIFDTILRSMGLSDLYHGVPNRQLADLYIAPPLPMLSPLDFKQTDQIIEIGYTTAREALQQWKEGRAGKAPPAGLWEA